MSSDPFMQAAIDEARAGLAEGGEPIGSVLVVDGKIVGRGRNQRVQRGSVILHAEMDAVENAGPLTRDQYRRAILYTTLSPCPMCSGMVVKFEIPTVIIAENRSARGPEDSLRAQGVKLTILDDQECIELMREFIRKNPTLWQEDVSD